MTDSIERLVHVYGFRLGREIGTKMDTGNGNVAAKIESSFIFGTMTVRMVISTAKLQSQIPRRKCVPVISIKIDNRKWKYIRQNRKYLYIWNYNR